MNDPWQQAFRLWLNRPPADSSRAQDRRLAVMGVGHELRGDDAAGLLAARGLQPYAGDAFLIVEAGSAPENFTAPVRRFAPHFLLFVDAADLHAPPGAIRWLEWEDTTGMSGSTHTMPLYLLARYLVQETHCQAGLIGIQPVDTSFGEFLSAPVAGAVAAVVEEIRDTTFQKHAEPCAHLKE